LGIVRILVTGIILVAGFGLLFVSASEIRIGLESTSYPTVDGTILESYLEIDSFDDLYRAVITFEYTVNSISYQSSAFKVG